MAKMPDARAVSTIPNLLKAFSLISPNRSWYFYNVNVVEIALCYIRAIPKRVRNKSSSEFTCMFLGINA